jgi:hypothetical protein
MAQKNSKDGVKKGDSAGSADLFSGGMGAANRPGPFGAGAAGGGHFQGKNATFGSGKGFNKGPGKKSGPIGGGGQKRSGFGGARGR